MSIGCAPLDDQRTAICPKFYAANYYEGIYVIAKLLRRARQAGVDYYKGERLLQANPKVPGVYGGDMVFQPDGTCPKRIGIFEVKDGKGNFEYLAEMA